MLNLTLEQIRERKPIDNTIKRPKKFNSFIQYLIFMKYINTILDFSYFVQNLKTEELKVIEKLYKN